MCVCVHCWGALGGLRAERGTARVCVCTAGRLRWHMDSVRVLGGLCTGGSTTLAEGCFFDLIDVNNRESSATS